MGGFSAALVLLALLVPTILSIQHKALTSPVLFFILVIAFVAWAVSK